MRKYLLNILIVLFIGFIAFTAVSCSDVSDSTSGTVKLAENKSYLDIGTDRLTEYVAYCDTNDNVSKYASLESSNSSCGLTVSGNTVTITTDESAKIYVRTESRNLIIDAKNADVHHYGSAGNVTIEHVAGSPYHGFATITNQLTLKSGHAELNEINVPLVVSYAPVTANGCKIGTYNAMSNDAVLTVDSDSKVSFVEKADGVSITTDEIISGGSAINKSAVSPSKLIEMVKVENSKTDNLTGTQTNDLNTLLINLLMYFVPSISSVTENNYTQLIKSIFSSPDGTKYQIDSASIEIEFDGKFAIHSKSVDGILLTVDTDDSTPIKFTDTKGNKLEIDFVYLVYLLQQSESINLKINKIEVSFYVELSSNKKYTFIITLNESPNPTNIKFSKSCIDIENLAISCEQEYSDTYSDKDHHMNLNFSARVYYNVINEENQIKFSFDVDSCTVLADIKFYESENNWMNFDGIITLDNSSLSNLTFDKTNKKFSAEGMRVDFGNAKADISVTSKASKTNVLNLIVEANNLGLAIIDKKPSLSINRSGFVAAGFVLADQENQNLAFYVNQLDGFTPVWNTTTAILDGSAVSAKGIIESDFISSVITLLNKF